VATSIDRDDQVQRSLAAAFIDIIDKVYSFLVFRFFAGQIVLRERCLKAVRATHPAKKRRYYPF